MACPHCGGSEREPIAPGYWRCTSSHTTAGMQVGPMPGTPQWAGIVGPQLTRGFVVCGHEYQEAAPAGGDASAMCECGTFAIGQCAECSRPVCGSHSKLVDGRRLCEADVADHAAETQAAQRLDDLRKYRSAEEAMRERLILHLQSLPSEIHRAVARAAASDTLGYGYGVHDVGYGSHREYGCVVRHVQERTWFADLPASEQHEATASWNDFVARADALCGGPFGSMTAPWRDAQHLTDWFFEQLPTEPISRYKFRYPRHLKDNRWPKLPKRGPGFTIGSESLIDDGGTRTTWLTTDALVLTGSFNWDSKEAWISAPVRELEASDVGLVGKTLKLGPSARDALSRARERDRLG